MPVTTEHPQYTKMKETWQFMQDSLEGEETIKDKREGYLRKTVGMHEAEKANQANSYLYDNYLKRAKYPLWVSDNRRSMVGLLAKLKFQIKLPSKLAHMEENATSDGFNLKQLFFRVVRNSLGFGRQALLVDIDNDQKPYIAVYDALSAINWRESGVDGRKDLILVVLKEQRKKDQNDEFSHDTETAYRVLSLNESGIYHVRVLNSAGAAIEEGKAVGSYDPTENKLIKGLNYIPLIFSGATDNSPDVDEIPLLTMAKNAIKYYELSADYFSELHQTAHAQPYVTGLRKDDELKVTGASMAWSLPQGATCGYLEISGSGLEEKRLAMDAERTSAIESGAKVVDIGGAESGEARKARQTDQHATLQSIVTLAASAIEQLLRFSADLLGIKGEEIVFTVDPTFSINVDPTMLDRLLQAVMASKISEQTYWDYLTSGKLPERLYEEEANLIGADNDGLKLDEESGQTTA